MLANIPELFDSVLVIAGLALVVTGLVMFISSKSSSDASSVEAFGIKLNVTHPSLILVLAGVGLMLAPRLLPELPGKTSQPEPAVIAEAPPPSDPTNGLPSIPTINAPSVVSSPPVTQTTPAPSIAHPIQSPTRTITTHTQKKTSSQSLAKSAVVPIAVPKSAATPVTPSQPPSSSPSPSQRAPVVIPAAPVTPAPPQADTAKPARPLVTYAALGLPTNRDFWSGETRTTYTRRMNASLQQAGRDVLRMETQPLNLGEAAFDAWWNESSQHPRSRGLCAEANAPRALLSARTETPTTTSVSESAYWPEFKLRLYVCATNRVYRQQKTLSPLNSDNWPFSTELNTEIERFMRTYRGDLVE
ncbi:MAG: hypothetical protein Q8K12_17275 [Thiobacillus sp.]|nr:hypothetical protein [Thiobacillus sp.]